MSFLCLKMHHKVSSCLSVSAAGGGVNILFEDELGVADFHLPDKSSVLYVSECDVIAGTSYKRKLVRFRNVSLKAGVPPPPCLAAP